jgi:hypothetical protein
MASRWRLSLSRSEPTLAALEVLRYATAWVPFATTFPRLFGVSTLWLSLVARQAILRLLDRKGEVLEPRTLSAHAPYASTDPSCAGILKLAAWIALPAFWSGQQ